MAELSKTNKFLLVYIYICIYINIILYYITEKQLIQNTFKNNLNSKYQTKKVI